MRGRLLRNARHWRHVPNSPFSPPQNAAPFLGSGVASSFVKRHTGAYVQSRLLKTLKESGLSPSISISSPKYGFTRWYLGMIERHPVLTKGITAGLIFTAADSFSQHQRYTLKFHYVLRISNGIMNCLSFLHLKDYVNVNKSLRINNNQFYAI
ncbi:hypothetical protein AMTR_s00044p00174020 [Amborella trichopoda]|uniref:Uncharacterized protein n=1 Tax=Amborella trichopoda TaxID=13333 RepID=U5D724_AMBTC|nr:hypothetical protein AMTR_s00044p00174020 [Amborella trichopoda]